MVTSIVVKLLKVKVGFDWIRFHVFWDYEVVRDRKIFLFKSETLGSLIHAVNMLRIGSKAALRLKVSRSQTGVIHTLVAPLVTV